MMATRHIAAVLFLAATLDVSATTKNGFDVDDALIPAREIRNGGPGRDGIPSLDHPVFVSSDEAGFLAPDDRVLGITINGAHRAYPIRILNYHEIVNDMVGGEAVVVTFCPLCGSGMAFRSTVNGERLAFGVSGLLYNSDVLLYDRQTKSLWSQLASIAVTGPYKGVRLDAVVLGNTTWRDWSDRHPDTEVLSTETGFRRNYSVNPYPNYSRTGRLYFPVSKKDRRYRNKAIVMGLEVDGQFKAYPLEELAEGPARFTDDFQGQSFEVRYDEANQTADITNADGDIEPTTLAFWFAWYAFHPDTEVYTSQ